MDRMGLQEGEVIQHRMITKSIERAQKKVEENNFGIRKRLLEYDDIMNSQREVIYTRRLHALYGERLDLDISNMLMDVSEAIVDEFISARDFNGFRIELLRILSIESPVETESVFFQSDTTELIVRLYNSAMDRYRAKSSVMAESALPVIKNVYEPQGATYKNIVIPVTDGRKTLQVVSNLEKACMSEGKELIKSFEKGIILAVIDDFWKEHLREMDDLKQSVQGAVYEQKDPLLIYKFEAFKLFREMIQKVNKEVISFLMKGSLPVQDPSQVRQAREIPSTDMKGLKTSKAEAGKGIPVRSENENRQQQPEPQNIILPIFDTKGSGC